MSISIRALPTFKEKAEQLGCQLPEGVCTFPRNFDSADDINSLEYDDSSQTLKKLLTQAGIRSNGLGLETNNYLQQRDNIPSISLFFAWTVCSQDPTSVQLAINVVGNYLTDHFKGFRFEEDQKCSIRIVRQRIKGKAQEYEELTYSGPVSGINIITEKLINGSD